MYRSATKSNADKQKMERTVQVTPPVEKLDIYDAVSDCLTWAQIQEEAEDIVVEIMDELLSKVMEGCLKVHIKRRLPAYCVSWARSYIIQTLEQQLLCRDEGDRPEEVSITEDSEPLPVIPDSWARGLVPVVAALSHHSLQQESDVIQVPAVPEANQQCNAMAHTYSSSKLSEKESSPRREVSDEHCKVLSPHRSPTTLRKKRLMVNLTPKPVPVKSLPPLSRSAEENNMMSEDRNRTHSYQPKDGPIKKIDPSSLSRHLGVPIQFEIVNNNCTKPKKSSGLSKLVPKQQTGRTATTLKPLSSSKDQATEFPQRNESNVFLKKPLPSIKEDMASSRALRLDTMVLTKGVTLLDPKEAEMTALKRLSSDQSIKLRPQRDVTVPWISADQFTAGPPPKVIPLSPRIDYKIQ